MEFDISELKTDTKDLVQVLDRHGFGRILEAVQDPEFWTRNGRFNRAAAARSLGMPTLRLNYLLDRLLECIKIHNYIEINDR